MWWRRLCFRGLLRTKIHISDSSAQTKRDELEFIKTSTVSDRHQPGPSPFPLWGRRRRVRRETGHRTRDIPRPHTPVVAPHVVPDWFVPPQVRRSDSLGHEWRDDLQRRLREIETTMEWCSLSKIVTVLGMAMNEVMETHTASTAAMMTVTTQRAREKSMESPKTRRTAVTMSSTQQNSGPIRGTSRT